MSNSQKQKTCGNIYPVDRAKIEVFLTENGFTPVGIESETFDDEIIKDDSSVIYQNGDVSVEIPREKLFKKSFVRLILKVAGFSIEHFETDCKFKNMIDGSVETLPYKK